MRRLGSPSEIRQLAAPVARLFDAAWRRMHWWVAAMAVLYAVSGITIVKPDEVAVVLRWGSLVGHTPALQQHGPGLLFAFPRPMDRVVRVQVKRVRELLVRALASGRYLSNAATLDPLTHGYALTGDQNIVHVDMVARYRVRDPAEWAFYGPKPEDVLRVEVAAGMVRSLGEMGVDRVLADGRKDLIAIATRRAQAGLDAAHSGLELSSLEVTRLAPPVALAEDFDAVQSAFIAAETKKKRAQAFAQGVIPKAQAEVDSALQSARAAAAAELAEAKGDAAAFLALERECRVDPAVVRERLYRDAVDSAISHAKTRWVPPPTDGKYHGLRISLVPTDSESAVDSMLEGSPTPSPRPPAEGMNGEEQ